MESALGVANYFLEKGKAEGKSITPMQLVKLVYIAHGWHLGLGGGKLFEDKIEAWKYGPVVPSVYNQFKEFGSSAISAYGTEIKFVDQTVSQTGGILFHTPKVEDQNTKAFLDSVWIKYKNYNGIELSAMTHQKNTPWDLVWNVAQGYTKHGAEIPSGLIERHYKEKANGN